MSPERSVSHVSGHSICDDLNSGISVADELTKFQAAHFEATPQSVQIMVDAAHQELCPSSKGQ